MSGIVKRQFVVLVLSIFTLSCSKIEVDNQISNRVSDFSNRSSFIPEQKVHRFVNQRRLSSKASLDPNYTIEAYETECGDTLMYLINFGQENGWMIISADDRTPVTLAEAPRGSISFSDNNPGFKTWLYILSNNMKRVRKSSDEQLSFSTEEIQYFKSCWEEEPQLDPGLNDGYWEVTTTSVTEVFDSCCHLTPRWDQDEPYNEYCPYASLTEYSGLRSLAGCVAVAGAEVLYCLHRKYGVPERMFSDAYCDGNLLTDSYYFGNAQSSVWAQMDTSYRTDSYSQRPEAIMIGYIGRLVNMHYWTTYSWALPNNLITNVFEPYGYSCSSGNYNETIVKNSLNDGVPVIITASDLLIPTDGDIHTFVIDGYMRTRIKFIHYHHWVDLGGGLLGSGDQINANIINRDYYTFSYSSPTVSAVKINLGWGDNISMNEVWYTLAAGWTVYDGEDIYDYNHNISMIYGFELSN